MSDCWVTSYCDKVSSCLHGGGEGLMMLTVHYKFDVLAQNIFFTQIRQNKTSNIFGFNVQI